MSSPGPSESICILALGLFAASTCSASVSKAPEARRMGKFFSGTVAGSCHDLSPGSGLLERYISSQRRARRDGLFGGNLRMVNVAICSQMYHTTTRKSLEIGMGHG